ncbi:alpha-N-arabinofuranosidase [Roseateles cellulosilyticus]|uniref:non-reducing end alpha-L-arabinofuranosidase n=1 Tax=Pelomonas cellulosilytica TaxID=2906762 RepID=A0ABS8Y443_9BURK|nr:alpha-L-arabinofuranosidase C-terminal domain-containing protein [Pelomonas sp. P8]MCE4557984.1 alpha-N-arabinofuranosidase [Pelomonas sp. P8]
MPPLLQSLIATLALAAVPLLQAAPLNATLVVEADKPGPRIDPNIYGQFVEHLGRGVHEGIWVGEGSPIPNVRGIRSDVVAALKRIKVPVIRWPGGCFAELYHWRDGIGPRDQRPRGVNAAWGDEPETNGFGSHEFMDLLEQIGAKAFLSVNLASGSTAEAQTWLHYLTDPATSGAGAERARNGHAAPYAVPYIGIGNENWGCGGNMTADYYADQYRQYLSVLRPFGTLIATDANADDYAWTETLLKRALYRHSRSTPLAWINKQPQLAMMSLHFYTFAGDDWDTKSPAVGFNETEWARSLLRTQKMDELITRHTAIMDRYDPARQVGLAVSEWGTWWSADPKRPSNLYQANTLRDAVIAGLTLNIFQDHADRVRMANLAQMANVLQALILTRGAQMIVTPTYHVFDLYQGHQGAKRVPVSVSAPGYRVDDVDLPSLSVSASLGEGGRLTLSIVNLRANDDIRIGIDLRGVAARTAQGRTVTAAAMDAHPDFDTPDALHPRPLAGLALQPQRLEVTVPAKSVNVIEINP